MTDSSFTLGGYSLAGVIRRVRREADLSQRQLAIAAKLAPSTVAAFETGKKIPSVDSLQRILNAANYLLVVLDSSGRAVPALDVWDNLADLAGRRFPPHLDTIVDPTYGEWWADRYGLARPPETFRRDRAIRDYERRMSRWEVRVAQCRLDEKPRPPNAWGAA